MSLDEDLLSYRIDKADVPALIGSHTSDFGNTKDYILHYGGQIYALIDDTFYEMLNYETYLKEATK